MCRQLVAALVIVTALGSAAAAPEPAEPSRQTSWQLYLTCCPCCKA